MGDTIRYEPPGSECLIYLNKRELTGKVLFPNGTSRDFVSDDIVSLMHEAKRLVDKRAEARTRAQSNVAVKLADRDRRAVRAFTVKRGRILG